MPGAARFTAKELAQGYSDTTVVAKPRVARRATVAAEESRDGVRIARIFSRFDDLRVIALDPADTADAALARLRATGRYDYVEPNFIRHATVTPNDPGFSQLWGLSNTGQVNGTPGADISAVPAWDLRTDASTVIVAVIDSGVNLAHTDIAANLWRNPNPTPGVNDLNGARFTAGNGTLTSGDPSDDVGHGTHVAGTIGAVGNNAVGIAGVAWKVQIMALKFLTAPTGSGSTADEVACIDYAIGHGAQIINASFGESGGATLSQTEFDAINRARAGGLVFVAAAGNDTANMDVSKHYPASLPLDNVVAIGASTRQDDLAVFSNYGAAVDLFAPGNDILSLDYAAPNGGTKLLSGTSMAAPHVSGALALLKAQFPGDNYRQLINRLLRGVDIGGNYSGKAQTNGRLNLRKALATATNRPFNDDFASRPRLAGDNLSMRTSNAGATAEPGEPAHAGQPATATLWWEWTAAGNTPVSITTAGSAYDTVLAVYTLSPTGAFTPVAANDDAPGVTTSAVSFTAAAGTSYEIAVDGKHGATGLTLLNLSAAPANDFFATPVTLTGISAHVTATNAQCTREPGEPLILGNAGGTSLWYQWTAPKTGRFAVSAFTLDFDPFVAVYTGTALNALTLVAANDNSGFDGSQPQSVCAFDALAGTTYRITVDAKPLSAGGSATGEFTLSLTDALWQASTGNSSLAGDAITGAPAVAPDGSIYFGVSGNEHTIYALNADGSLKWRFNASGATDTCSPAVAADGTIYVGTTTGNFYALNPGGTRKWLHSFGSTLSASNSPAVAADGTVYIKVSDGKLYALDPTTGATRWSFDSHGLSSYASPVIAPDGTIYLGSDDDHLYAINPNGSQKWAFATAVNEDVYTTPAIDAAGNVYFGALNTGRFFSITAAGALRWIYTESFDSLSSSPALSANGDTVYVGSYDRRLHAIDTTSGAARWTAQLGGQVRASSPAIDANGAVYVGCYDFKIYAINPDGSLLRTYDTGAMVRSSPAIVGNTLLIGSSDRKLYAFDLGTHAAAGNWPQYRANARRTGRALADIFALTAAPPALTSAVIGYPFSLSVSAVSPAALAYQWLDNGAAIAGATNATFSVATATTASAGTYTVLVTGAGSTITSPPALVVVQPPLPGRLMNLSARADLGATGRSMVIGFALRNGGTKPMLIRAVGPTLASLGLASPLANPTLKLFSADGNALLAVNDDWGDDPAVAAATAQVGAFALPAGSKDAALLRPLAAANYTAIVAPSAASSGIAPNAAIVLAEFYDADPTPLGAQTLASVSRLVNLSALAPVGTGGGVLIAGFVISGNIPKTVLIRAVGPSLAPLGVAGALADPRLDLYSGTTVLQSNDNWGGASNLTAAFAATGAFSFTNAASFDAALLATLAPGSYTAQVSGVGGTTGIALVEVYEVSD